MSAHGNSRWLMQAKDQLNETDTFWWHDTECYTHGFPAGTISHGCGEGQGYDEAQLLEVEDLDQFQAWCEAIIESSEPAIFTEAVEMEVRDSFESFVDSLEDDLEGKDSWNAGRVVQQAMNRTRINARLDEQGVSREEYDARMAYEWKHLFTCEGDEGYQPEPEWRDSTRWMNHPSWYVEMAGQEGWEHGRDF